MTKSRPVALLGEQSPPRYRVAPPPAHPGYNSWEDVSDLCRSFGLVLDPWQETVLQASMGERSDGLWAAKRVGLSAPRQNGKSQLIVARALAGALLFGERKIVVSAHQQDTAREAFQKFLDLRDTSPALAARMPERLTMNAINREQLKFTNGATIQFKARTAPGGRGFSSDCLMLDEAQRLSQPAWASINSTMSARPNPQVWLLGTPPTPEDDSEVFSSVRSAALEGRSSAAAWLEWSAGPDDDPADEATRAKANPAWFTRINHDVVQGEFETYSVQQFAVERLGIWESVATRQVIDADSWAAVADTNSRPVDRLVLAVDVDPDQSRASVALAGMRADGLAHVEIYEQRTGTGWLAPWIAEKASTAKLAAVVVDGKSPAVPLVDELTRRKVRNVVVTGADDMATACAGLFESVMERTVRHTDQPQLTAALAVASKRPLGDRWAWNRKTATSDITPLVAVTLALWGVQTSRVKAAPGIPRRLR